MRRRRRTATNREEKITDIRTMYRRFVNIKMTEGVSERTLVQYRDNFDFFCDYIEMKGGDYSLRAIDADFIRSWIHYMQFEHRLFPGDKNRISNDIGMKPSTINTRLKTIKAMYNRLFESNLISDNPLAEIRRVKEVEPEIDILDSDEIKRLLAIIETQYYTGFRDFVLTRVLLDTMMRINEALSIRIIDVKENEGLIVIPASVAKSRKSRIVPVDNHSINLMKDLVKENKYMFDSLYVFATSENEIYNSDNYRTRLKRYAAKAGITKNVYPHLLRHTAATRWIESGGDLEDLRKILGHSKYEMVKRYTHIADRSVIKSAGKYSMFRNLDE